MCHLSLLSPPALSQERFQVKNPPHTYIQKLQSFLDPNVTRKVKYGPARPLCLGAGRQLQRKEGVFLGSESRAWGGQDGRETLPTLSCPPVVPLTPWICNGKLDWAPINDRGPPRLQKFRRRVQESTKVLRELEISLRTNHIG